MIEQNWKSVKDFPPPTDTIIEFWYDGGVYTGKVFSCREEKYWIFESMIHDENIKVYARYWRNRSIGPKE